MRRLIRIPIIHTSVELGSLQKAVKAEFVQRFGANDWQSHEALIAKLWDMIEEKLAALELDYRKVRIYQDGLPVCGFEEKIVRELADAGSRNYQLVSALMEKGATVTGTEDAQLLIREYRSYQQRLEGAVPASQKTPDSEQLLEARDRFIARQIDETLREGETGLLFLGAAHRLEALQSTDLQVETLDDLGGTKAAGQ